MEARVVFVDLDLGVETIRELVRGFEQRTMAQKNPPIYVAVIGVPTSVDERRALIVAGAPLFIEADALSLSLQARLLQQLLHARAEQAARQPGRGRAEEELTRILARVPDAVLIHQNERVVWANQKWADLTGYDDPASIVGIPVYEFVGAAYREIVAKRVRLRAQGSEIPPLEQTISRRDGTEVPVVAIGLPATYAGDFAFIVFARDLTEQRRLRARLAVSDRLAALGTLAAGIGHEINNPLAYAIENIRQAAERLRTGIGSREDALSLLDEALDGTERVRGIVQDLKILSRADAEQRMPVDVHQVLEAALRMANSAIVDRAKVVRNFEDVPKVSASEPRLAQVFLNLLLNAAQAIPRGDSDEQTITVSTRLEGDRVVIAIRDTGVGIAPGDLERVFEPFFTTKADLGGTGLGLSICHSLVTASGGDLSVESELGKGTVVTIRLGLFTIPIVGTRTTSIASSSPPVDASGEQRRRILIIDDESALGRVLAVGFRPHEVVVAASGREGLERIENDAPYEAILCDLMMPDMSGADVYEYLKENKPGAEQRIIFMSGSAFTSQARDFLTATPNPCLQKPFQVADALQAIEEAIRRAEQGGGVQRRP